MKIKSLYEGRNDETWCRTKETVIIYNGFSEIDWGIHVFKRKKEMKRYHQL